MIANFAAITTKLHLKYISSWFQHTYIMMMMYYYKKYTLGYGVVDRDLLFTYYHQQVKKKRTTQSQWTADNASNQYLQKSDQFSLSLHPSFLSQGNTLPWEKAIYSEAGAHKFTATAIIFHQIIMINPNFLKKAPSDNYRWRTTTHLLSRLYYGITGVPLHKMSLCYKHKSINQTQQ